MTDAKENTYIGSPDNPRTTAVVSYITFIGWLIAYFGLYPKNRTSHSSFHLRQSLLIHILSLLVKIFYSFSYASSTTLVVTGVLTILVFILWLSGFVDALNGRQRPLPLIGSLSQKLFNGI
jgi:uncharacterized membrane protein